MEEGIAEKQNRKRKKYLNPLQSYFFFTSALKIKACSKTKKGKVFPAIIVSFLLAQTEGGGTAILIRKA